MATIKDVAKAAGVGTGTVSRALSDPSALLKRKNNKKVKSGLIGVVLPNSSQPFSEVFCGM